MAEPAPTGHRRAALFVDFENVYPGLCASSREAGRRFATDPARWVRWMEQGMGPMLVDADDAPRVLLRRICYLDPARSSRFRPYFTRAGFRIVDCPALTAAGKNSADIYMVLDILDTLRHPTYFEEFIVLSVDADFTPVLLRLREHDRRTAMLVSGPTAAAMQAACDFAIPDAMFLDEALGLGADEAEHVLATADPPGDKPDGVPAIRDRMEHVVRAVVASATEPVPMAVAAHEVRRAVGDGVAATQWGGCGTFGRLVAGFADATLRVDTSRAPGYLYDPSRHAPPETDGPAGTRPDGVPEVAERVHRVVGAPLLAPEGYRRLFEVLEKDARLAAEDGQASAERAARDACARLGQPIPRAAVHFVLLGFRYSGVDWTEAERDAGSLANAFANNVLRLAADAQMDLGETEQSQIRSWIAGPL
ncbi:MAG: NYN domain-containing protein [Micromonosporaceae bacterium]|nr:NYN domain-containing protein [Micromonosporaceae bacterium]